MACQCQSNMNFSDANYIYKRAGKKGCCGTEPVVTPVSTNGRRSCGCGQNTNAAAAVNDSGCPGVNFACLEDTVIPCEAMDCCAVERCLEYRTCCDPNGICCRYPCCCREQFWPSFTHPRWLCCNQLYHVD